MEAGGKRSIFIFMTREKGSIFKPFTCNLVIKFRYQSFIFHFVDFIVYT